MRAFLLISLLNIQLAYSNDTCLDKCQIISNVENFQEVRCTCETKKISNLSHWKKRKNTEIPTPNSKTQLQGISKRSLASVLDPSCKDRLKAPLFEQESGVELAEVSDLSTLPTCDCLNYRARFPLKKMCTISKAGEKYCSYQLKINSKTENKPIRKLTWLDVQACEVKMSNYRKPTSCVNNECKTDLPNCSAGYELINIADSGSCCPKYVCKLGGYL